MKSIKFIISVMFFMALTSISFADTPIDDEIISPADMQVYVVADNIIIDYINPLNENLTITVTNLDGMMLKIVQTTEPAGQLSYNNAELIALGGTGMYQVTLWANDKKRKVETVVVVITAE